MSLNLSALAAAADDPRFKTFLHRFPVLASAVEDASHANVSRRQKKKMAKLASREDGTQSAPPNISSATKSRRSKRGEDVENGEETKKKPIWRPVNGWEARREIKTPAPMRAHPDEPGKILCVVREEKSENYVTIAPFVPTGANGAAKDLLVNKKFLCAPEVVSASLLPPSFLHHLTRQYGSVPFQQLVKQSSESSSPGEFPDIALPPLLSFEPMRELRPSKRLHVQFTPKGSASPTMPSPSKPLTPVSTENQIKNINQRLQSILQKDKIAPLKSSPDSSREYAQNVVDSSPVKSIRSFRAMLQRAAEATDLARGK